MHFEIIGNGPPRLRRYYGDLFGWEFDTSGPAAEGCPNCTVRYDSSGYIV